MSQILFINNFYIRKASLIKDYNRKGISAPEFVGADEKCFSKIMADLKIRGIILEQSIK